MKLRVETSSAAANMAASQPSSVEVVTVEREHCFRHESEIKKQKKGKDLTIDMYVTVICPWKHCFLSLGRGLVKIVL